MSTFCVESLANATAALDKAHTQTRDGQLVMNRDGDEIWIENDGYTK